MDSGSGKLVGPEKARLRAEAKRGTRNKSGAELMEEAEPKAPKEALELLEVHGCGAEEGVDGIAGGAFEPVALKPMFALEVSDGGFDRRAAFHPTPECFGRRSSAAFVAMHRLRAGVIVTAIAHADVRFPGWFGFSSDQPAHLGELLLQRVPVVGIVRQAEGAGQPTALAGGRDARLVAKLIFFPGLALGDTADLGFMHAVDFVFVGRLLGVDAPGGG